MITLERLREVLDYDQETGLFTWRASRTGVSAAGAVAGGVEHGRYGRRNIRIRVDNQRFLAHRLAWFYVTGSWPEQQIDHINGDSEDNRFSNLRLATNAENCRNKKVYSTSQSGIAGVGWHKRHRKYAARICLNGKLRHLGYFKTVDEAVEARRKAARELHGEFARFA